jgi:hypothetical protein
LKAAENLFETGLSPWIFEAAEFPVSLKGTPLHIDFILRNRNENSYFVAECKRCDPSVSNWCFVKAPYVSRGAFSGRERIVRELILKKKESSVVQTGLQWITRSSDIYHLPFELKNRDKGEGHYGRGKIDEAVTQVLRGLNGLIDLAIESAKKSTKAFLNFDRSDNLYASFMPVIFTTAKLWTCACDISAGDIESGKIDIGDAKLTEKKWLFYQYGQSPALKHAYSSVRQESDISEILYLDYTRTIPIVNAAAIGDFLSDGFWKDPDDWQKDLPTR